MANTMKCECGQVLDIEGFQPAAKIRCPKCQKVLTVPPPMAVAVAIDSDSDMGAPAGGPPKRQVSLTEQRRQADRQAAYASQGKLKKVMIWPCLLLGLICLFVVSGLGVYWQWFEPKVIEVVKEADGVDHLKARVEIPGKPNEYEKIEVQPSLIPGDVKAEDEKDFNVVSTLGGKPVRQEGGFFWVPLEGKVVPLARRGLWFYEVDPVTKKIGRKVEVPLIAQDRTSDGYVPVEVRGTSFIRRGTEDSVDVAYYKIEDQYQANKLGKFKGEDEDDTWGGQLKQKPWIFIATGLPIGLLLLFAAGFFIYESYFSKTAKAAAEKAAAEKAAQEAKDLAAASKT